MTVAIGMMLPELRVQLPGIPEPILTAAMYRVLRQFFWESEVWKYTYDNGLDWTASQLAMETPVAGTDIPTKTVVKRVDNVKYDAGGDAWDTPVPFKTRDQLDRESPNWRTNTGSSPRAWAYDNDGAAIVVPLVGTTVTTALLIRAIIAPVFTATTDTLPALLYYEFEETIKAGILAQTLKIPGKDWTDVNLAILHATVASAGIKAAKSRGQADFGQPEDTMAYGGI